MKIEIPDENVKGAPGSSATPMRVPADAQVEYANQKVWVRASRVVLDQIRAGWSVPVQVTASENADGSCEMTFRTYDPNRVERDGVTAHKSDGSGSGEVSLINVVRNSEEGK